MPLLSTVSDVSLFCARIIFPNFSKCENSSLVMESLGTHSNSASSFFSSNPLSAVAVVFVFLFYFNK